jgi:hypothetical protein
MTANGESIQRIVHGQHVFHQLRRHPIAHQRSPFGFQKQQLRRHMFRKNIRQGDESFGFMRSTATVVQSWALHLQVIEDGSDRQVMKAIARPRDAAIRALQVRGQAN